jgi:ribose transport system substrate-binding protein
MRNESESNMKNDSKRRHRGAIRRYPLTLAAVISAAALTAAACSSSSSSAPGVASSSAPSASGSQSAAASGVQAAAQKFIDNYSQRPTQIPVTTPLTEKPPTGKVIDWLTSPAPDDTGFLPYADAAAKALGWKLVVIQEGQTPATIKAAWDQVVKNKPDAVYDAGDARSIFATELAQIKALNIPFVQLGSVDPPGGGVTAVVEGAPPFVLEGKMIANWAVAQFGTQTHALDVQISGFAAVTLTTNTFNTTVTQICPSCTVGTLNFNVLQLGTPAIADGAIAYLKGHPQINVLFSPFPSAAAGIAQQLSIAGIHNVKVITGGETDIYNEVKNGTVASAVYRQDPEWVYMVFDAFARIFNHESTAPDVQTQSSVLMWIVNKNTIPAQAASGVYFPLVQGSQQQFFKLWHVS